MNLPGNILLTIDMALVIEKLVLIAVVVMSSLVIAMYTTFAERKLAAVMQDRRGPNRAGPFGLLQPMADGLKLFFKEEIIPNFSSGFLFILGPCLAMLTAMMTGAVIPGRQGAAFRPRNQFADRRCEYRYLVCVRCGEHGRLWHHDWQLGQQQQVFIDGGLRAASQIISYELAMGISLIALLMVTGTLSLKGMVNQQLDGYWNIFKQPLGFLIFLVCVFAECNRTPFDLPEAENELIGGYHTEYSSMKLGFYLFSEYINMFISSAVMVSLFFGGYDIPLLNDAEFALRHGDNLMALLHAGMLLVKIVFFLFLFIWVRWTIPRFRYDQLMNLGWKVMIPLALANMLVTGACILAFSGR